MTTRRSDSVTAFSREVDRMRQRVDELREAAAARSREELEELLLAELSAAHQKLRDAEATLHSQQEELDRIAQDHRDVQQHRAGFVADLPVPVLVTDASGVIHTANTAAADLLGSQGQLLGRPLTELVSPGDTRRVAVAVTVEPDGGPGRKDVTWVLLDTAALRATQGATEPEQERFAGARLAHALVDLTQATLSAPLASDALSEAAVVCQGAFSRPVAVSITIGEPAAPERVATGAKLAQNLDGAQMVAGEGPTHEGWTGRRVVHTSDLRSDRRWPRLAQQMSDSPVRAAIAAPIEVSGYLVGMLNVYSTSPDLVDAAAVETAELLATAVASTLHESKVKHELEAVAAQLETALQSRATIDQAKGIIMARQGCDADEAFRVLAEASSSANVKLREIADRLVSEAAEGPQDHH